MGEPWSRTELMLAWWKSVHDAKGTYYREMRTMDTRTIVSVEPKADDPGHFTMHLSDDSVATVADFIDSPEGIRVEIRSDDGAGTGDGPLLSDEIRHAFEGYGVEGIPVHAPVIELDSPAAVVEESLPADAPPIPLTATETIDVPSLARAQDAPMTQRCAPDTHVVVHAESISAIGRLLADAKEGIEGAFEKLEHAFAHVFHHGSAS